MPYIEGCWVLRCYKKKKSGVEYTSLIFAILPAKIMFWQFNWYILCYSKGRWLCCCLWGWHNLGFEQGNKSSEAEEPNYPRQSRIQDYAVKFLEYNSQTSGSLVLAEAPPTPDRLNDFGTLKVSDLSEVNYCNFVQSFYDWFFFITFTSRYLVLTPW